MKKIITALMLMFSIAGIAHACPAGEHPHGGEGSHHKGGYCS